MNKGDFMKDLVNSQIYLDSREVAEMTGKEHKELLRDIRTYECYLGESNFALTDFFIESTYMSSQNKELPCYQITKKGCEFIAHKLTGQKGAMFTARYINKFHDMEQKLAKPLQIDSRFLYQIAEQLEEKEKALQIAHTENKLLSQQTLEWANRKLIEALVKKCGNKIGYAEAWRDFKKELLYAHSININLRITNKMNATGRKTKPKTLSMIHDEELSACLSTAVALCKLNDVNIDDILIKFKEVV